VRKSESLLNEQKKAVCDLDVQASNLIDSMNLKLIYALTLCRQFLGALGFAMEINLSLKAAVVEVHLAVGISPLTENPDKAARELAEAENEMDKKDQEEAANEQQVSLMTEEEAPEKSIGIMKEMLLNAVKRLAKNIQTTSKRMGNLGLTGSFGAAVIIGIAMYGCEFSIGVDVKMGEEVVGEGHNLGGGSQLGRALKNKPAETTNS